MERRNKHGPGEPLRSGDTPHSERAGRVKSLSRALAIARIIGRNPKGLGVTEIARIADLPVSTVHRLLTTLEEEHFVRFDRERATWLVGVDAFTFGIGFVYSRDLAVMARPILRILAEESGETANLAILDGYHALYLSQVESRHVVRVIANPGERVQLHCSAIGKVLLAYMPEDELAKALRQLTMAPLTTKTIQSVDELRRELDVIRTYGYSTDDEEHTLDVRCIAGAIFSEHGLPIAALSLSGPKTRVTAERMRILGVLVGQAAGKLTADYGGHIPSTPYFASRAGEPGAAAVG